MQSWARNRGVHITPASDACARLAVTDQGFHAQLVDSGGKKGVKGAAARAIVANG